MKVVQPAAELIWITPDAQRVIERCGRVAYKSESCITNDSCERFLRKLIELHHEAVLEHATASIQFVCDRGVLAELTRHRLCAYTVESTRFCCYAKDKFDQEITVVEPNFWSTRTAEDGGELSYEDWCKWQVWRSQMVECETAYMELIKLGATAQEARSVLPNSLKTTIVMTTNMREWRHVLRLRLARDAHPQIRQIMLLALDILYTQCPIIFEDIKREYND